jgi:hypothetical protein
MKNKPIVYQIISNFKSDEMTFLFISKGKIDIVKAIQYRFIKKLNEHNIYNLGFGDYDIENNIILDKIDSNNNDVYKVLNTVLSSIPKFFQHYKYDYLFVKGSDGDMEFINQCFKSCTRKCTKKCKNINRRINIYTKYIDKNFEALCTEYQFFGGKKDDLGQDVFENYIRYTKYESILLRIKNTTFAL